jgi:hypothetical protein
VIGRGERGGEEGSALDRLLHICLSSCVGEGVELFSVTDTLKCQCFHIGGRCLHRVAPPSNMESLTPSWVQGTASSMITQDKVIF